MKAARLFSILGLLEEDLIEEADPSATLPSQTRRTFRTWGLVACCVVICGTLLWGGALWIAGAGSDSSTSANTAEDTADAGAPADGATGGSSGIDSCGFLSYGGPVLPLTTLETGTGLTAERTLTWDFAPGVYEDGSPRQWGAQVIDRYLLTNPTDADVTITALYPIIGSFLSLSEIAPDLTVDGAAADDTLYAGPYAGEFRDAGEDDGSTWNLSEPSTWEDYAALLSDGAYQDRALEDAPVLDIPVTVYRFSEFEAPHEQYDAATQAVEFIIDPSATTILSYGFNGLSQDPTTGWRQYDYFVPDGVRGESDLKLLIVLGDDLTGYTLQGYANGACEEAIDGVRCTVTREETTLDTVLTELCRAELEQQDDSWQLSALPLTVYQKAVAELLADWGVLSSSGADRYADGRLDDLLQDVQAQSRILYLAIPVTIPAGGSTEISVSFWKEPSYDFGGSGTGREDLQGFDLLTTAGSALEFASQQVQLMNMGHVEIVQEDLGLSDRTESALDLSLSHYALEVRPTQSDTE